MKCCSRNEKNNTVFHLRIKGGGGRGSLKEEGTLYLSFPEKGGGGGGGGGGAYWRVYGICLYISMAIRSIGSI